MRVLLGVTGGIAAYKVALVARRLVEDGHAVRVIPTEASLNFVGRATWEALTGQPARSGTFENVPSVEHVLLGQRADVVLVAPATADFLASYAQGVAKDLLGNAPLATSAPVLVAPAMHTEMWLHRATQANVAVLRERGVHVLEPEVGRLTGADSGPGRLPEPEHLIEALYALVEHRAIADGRGLSGVAAEAGGWGDMDGMRVVITAGGTHEPIDAVRFLGNRSTGHQGFALAEAARERGAHVTTIAANVALPLGEGIDRVDVSTGTEMGHALSLHADGADVVVMAAAVADYRPLAYSESKLKKTGNALTLELAETEDLLARLVRDKSSGQIVVGFAAETGDSEGTALEHGVAKAKRKGADLLAVNRVGVAEGFGDVPNAVALVTARGEVVGEVAGSKLAVAHGIWDAVMALRSSTPVVVSPRAREA